MPNLQFAELEVVTISLLDAEGRPAPLPEEATVVFTSSDPALAVSPVSGNCRMAVATNHAAGTGVVLSAELTPLDGKPSLKGVSEPIGVLGAPPKKVTVCLH